MKLRLIEGGAGSGKSRLCLEELAARQKAEPLGPPLLLLVPEQATFGSEPMWRLRPRLGRNRLAQACVCRR